MATSRYRFSSPLLRRNANIAAAAAEAAASGEPPPTFIELSDRPVDTTIVREGYAVPQFKLQGDALRDYLAITPKSKPRIVSQSITPGTPVTVGATIDLVLAEPGTIPIKVIDGHHLGLADQTIGDIEKKFFGNAELKAAVARAETVSALSDREKTLLRDQFRTNGVEVDDNQVGRDLASGLATLRAAGAFLTGGV